MKKLFALVIAVTILSSCIQGKETPSFETTSVIKEEKKDYKAETIMIRSHYIDIFYYKGHKYINNGDRSGWTHTEDCTERHHIEASKRW